MAINILYVETGLGKGGSALSLKCLIDRLDRERFNPILLFDHPAADVKGIHWSNIEVLFDPQRISLGESIRWGRWMSPVISATDFLCRILPEAFRFSQLLKRKKISFVHFNNDIHSHGYGIIACRLTKTPFVCHLRSTRKLIKTEKWFAKLVDRFIVLSESGKEFFIKEGIPENKITVSLDPFEVISVNQQVDSSVSKLFDRPEKKVGVCSRIVPGKGHEIFIKAAALVLKEFKNVHFYIVGSEAADSKGYKLELESLIESLKISEFIRFTGWVNHVSAAMSKMDMIVDPSVLAEGLRRTLVEALMMGKPFIASCVGQTPELAEKSKGGLIVEGNSPSEYAEKILKLLKEKSVCQDMGRKGKDYVIRMFNADDKAKEIQSLYEKILSN